MPRRNVVLLPGHCYHVYNRGHDRRTIFGGDADYSRFVAILRETVVDAGDQVFAYCLMPNHFHLMLRPATPDANRRIGLLQMRYSKAHQRRTGRLGPLYQSKFEAVDVDTQRYAWVLSRYIHRNLCEAGLCRRPADWPWSSYQEYAGLRQGTLPTTGPVLSGSTAIAYCRFVEFEPEPLLPSDLAIDRGRM